MSSSGLQMHLRKKDTSTQRETQRDTKTEPLRPFQVLEFLLLALLLWASILTMHSKN